MRRLLLCLLAIVFPIRLLAVESSPNVIFILADDLGWNALGCYGNDLVETPNLDRLAGDGMRFTHAYALSQCLPTRAAFLSGQYGARTGLTSVETASPDYAPLISPGRPEGLDPSVYTWVEMLRDVGYATGISGKWHLGVANGCDQVLRKAGMNYFREFGFTWVGTTPNAAKDKHVTAITEDLLGFMETHRDQPFVAYFAHRSPHTPFEVPAEKVARQVERGLPLSSDPDGVFEERVTADYVAMIEHLDASVGRVLDRLDVLGLTDRTLLVFLSDNGGLTRVWDNTPLRGGKGQLYEGGVRVPMIVRWPGVVEPGSVSDTPVHVVDWYPTLQEMLGAVLPQGTILDGESLMPLLTRAGELDRKAVFSHHPEYVVAFAKTPCSMIRKGDYKLIHYFGDYLDPKGCEPRPHTLSGRFVLGAKTELFHLAEDPGETRDLAATEPEKVAELMAELEAWWKETGARMPRPNPQPDPSQWIWNQEP